MIAVVMEDAKWDGPVEVYLGKGLFLLQERFWTKEMCKIGLWRNPEERMNQ